MKKAREQQRRVADDTIIGIVLLIAFTVTLTVMARYGLTLGAL